jgi:hypothetical protein
VTGAAIGGQLRKGETATLIEPVRHWYKIRLADGTEGFVSKGWSQRLATPEGLRQRRRPRPTWRSRSTSWMSAQGFFGRHETSFAGEFSGRGAADARASDTPFVQEQSRSDVRSDARRCAVEGPPVLRRCVVRANLPKSLSVGLECYDAGSAYVGTRRAANVDQLGYDVWRAVTSGSPSSRPLHSYRYIHVEPFDAPYGRFDLLVSLLRQAAVFTVIDQHELITMPEPQRDLILRCRLDHIDVSPDNAGSRN